MAIPVSPTVPTASTAHALALTKEKFVSLVTFRKDGRSVPTPVWFAEDGGKLYVYTGATSGKVKRIRATGKVTVAACDRQGKVTGPVYDATARLLPMSDKTKVDTLLNKKYGLQKRLFAFVMGAARLVRRGPEGENAYIEITLA